MDYACPSDNCSAEPTVFIDGTVWCPECQSMELFEVNDFEQPDSFEQYDDDFFAYLHVPIESTYTEYLRMLDVYYSGQRGFPCDEAQQKFKDLLLAIQVQFMGWIVDFAKQREERRKKQKSRINKIVDEAARDTRRRASRGGV